MREKENSISMLDLGSQCKEILRSYKLRSDSYVSHTPKEDNIIKCLYSNSYKTTIQIQMENKN